jgi:chitinase
MKALVVAALYLFSTISIADAATTAPLVVGYYPSWKSVVSPETIRYEQFTHLCHAFLTTTATGELKAEGNLPTKELTSLAHAKNVKVLLSLGGMDSNKYFGPLVRDANASSRFIDGVMKMVIEHNYDGIDLDWEFPKGPEERDAMTSMAGIFRQKMDAHKPGMLLTSAVSGSTWAARSIDGPALLPLMDFMMVMTYDMHGPWSDHAGLNSVLERDPHDKDGCSLFTVSGQMAHWTDSKGWPKDKLLVGVPCYGRGFSVDAWYQPIKYGDKVKFPYLPFRDVDSLLKQGWNRHWNEGAQAPWLSKQGVKELISYDDEESAAAKGKWAAQNGFRGVFFWEISQDYVNGQHKLVQAATDAYVKAARSASNSGSGSPSSQ